MDDMAKELEACVALLQERFGPDVLCDVVPLDDACAELLPAERECVAQALPARRREFAAGRACARRLLARLGFAPEALRRASDRSPLWPRGAIGSIAHSGSLCAVAVARTGRLSALGLDTEPDEPLEDDLWSTICTPRELDSLSAGPPGARGRTVRLVFSAKESVYKCLYPRTRAVLEFHEVEIDLVSDGNLFRAFVRQPAQAATAAVELEGFHLACAGSIFTGAALPAR
jgi:4'-phosphopantetheinyl transferase EntD